MANAAIIITIIILIIVVATTIILYFYETDRKKSIGQKCDQTSDCQSGLVCFSQKCYADFGSQCQTLNDCVPGSIRCLDGICVGGYGLLNEPCEVDNVCYSGLVCSTDNICKYPDGTSCQTGDVCINGVCIDGKCGSPQPIAYSCSKDSDCETGLVCSIGFCQNSDITTGSIGAACSDTGDKNMASCDQNLVCINGICQDSPDGQGCQDSSDCDDGFICFNNQCIKNPNICPCLSGFDCVDNGCLAIANQPCTSGNQCASGCCQSISNILQLIPNTTNAKIMDGSFIVIRDYTLSQPASRLVVETSKKIYASTSSGLFLTMNDGWSQYLPATIIINDANATYIVASTKYAAYKTNNGDAIYKYFSNDGDFSGSKISSIPVEDISGNVIKISDMSAYDADDSQMIVIISESNGYFFQKTSKKFISITSALQQLIKDNYDEFLSDTVILSQPYVFGPSNFLIVANNSTMAAIYSMTIDMNSGTIINYQKLFPPANVNVKNIYTYAIKITKKKANGFVNTNMGLYFMYDNSSVISKMEMSTHSVGGGSPHGSFCLCQGICQ